MTLTDEEKTRLSQYLVTRLWLLVGMMPDSKKQRGGFWEDEVNEIKTLQRVITKQKIDEKLKEKLREIFA